MAFSIAGNPPPSPPPPFSLWWMDIHILSIAAGPWCWCIVCSGVHFTHNIRLGEVARNCLWNIYIGLMGSKDSILLRGSFHTVGGDWEGRWLKLHWLRLGLEL